MTCPHDQTTRPHPIAATSHSWAVFMLKLAAIALVLSVVTPLTRAALDDQNEPLAKQGYLGLLLRDIPGGHTVVSWVFPGPLQGVGITPGPFDIARPDLIVALDGEPVTAEDFADSIRTHSPGDSVTIEYRKSNARGGTIPDELNHEDEILTLKVTIESRDEWTGTISRPRGHSTTVKLGSGRMLDPWSSSSVIGSAIAEHELVEPLRALTDVLGSWQTRSEDYHSLSRVRAGFDDPFCLPELYQLVVEPTRSSASDPIKSAAKLARANLDLRKSISPGFSETRPRSLSPFQLSVTHSLFVAAEKAKLALGSSYRDERIAADSLAFLRVPGTTFTLAGPDTKANIAIIRRSMDIDFANLVAALEDLGSLSKRSPEQWRSEAQPDSAGPGDGVEGEILWAIEVESFGWLIVGGEGPNRYDMAMVSGVIDLGGDDVYHATDLRLGCSIIMDFAGNDHYSGTPDQGPGGALLGASLIDDRGGNDVYTGELLACGSAMFGVSLLLDHDGNDIYTGGEWSIGAAVYGAGMLIDLGSGNDQYLGEFLCQGVGGPRGFGAIIDENGRDLYRANGPKPSAYGTAAVFQSFSQGIGFGYRNYAAGGVGMISDLGGDDRYEAGEFAQGGAYYWGLGILCDVSGRDLYYGNRYGQGFGVHQAVGILADEAGDDTYWSMTAASQGSAWDIGVGLLLDKSGADSYQCDGLGQGGASQQALAMLVDLAGVDRYTAAGGATQGQSGGDNYHFHETNTYSFSLQLDLGGANDYYSRGRLNDQRTSTGSLNSDDPQASSLHGICIDE